MKAIELLRPKRKVREVAIEGKPVAVSDTATGFLGRVLWYSCYKLSIGYNDFIELLKENSIPEGLWPPKTRPVDAFKKACRDVESKEYIVTKDVVEKVKYDYGSKIERKEREVIPNSMIIARRVREERGRKHRGDPGGALPVVMRVMFDNGDLVFRDVSGEDSEVLQELISLRYDFYKEHLVADDLRFFLNHAVKSMHPIQLKTSGGVYFVTEKHAGLVEGLSGVVETFRESSHGTEFVTLPVVDRHPERATILYKYETETTARLKELTEKCLTMVKEGRKLFPSWFKKFQDEYEWLQKQKEEYEELLETSMTKVNTHLDLLQKAMAKLSENIIEKGS